jgi:hypothetical protein
MARIGQSAVLKLRRIFIATCWHSRPLSLSDIARTISFHDSSPAPRDRDGSHEHARDMLRESFTLIFFSARPFITVGD